jgi:hypothetical protein
MRLPKWVGSLLKIGTPWIPGVGTAVEERLDYLEERQPSMTPEDAAHRLLLRKALTITFKIH